MFIIHYNSPIIRVKKELCVHQGQVYFVIKLLHVHYVCIKLEKLETKDYNCLLRKNIFNNMRSIRKLKFAF